MVPPMRTALLIVSLTAASSTTLLAAPPAPKIVKRVVVSLGGRKSRTCVTTTAPDGAISVALDVLENGRGPHVDSTLRLAPDGTISSLTASGHHTMGTKVAESFTRDGQHVRWHSEEERGEKDLPVGAFFVPMSEVPESLGLLTQALIKAGGTLPL